MNKSILLLTTGGTISSEYDKETNRIITRLSGEELFKRMGRDFDGLDITVKTFDILPSCHLTIPVIQRLANEIKREIEQNHYDGVVVSQGTDTLEETSFLVDLLVDTQTPIVFTGAMKSHFDLYADAFGNLEASILAAASPKSKGYGVLVVMNGEIHSSRDVRKTDTERINAFSSGSIGHIGRVFDNQVHYFRSIEPLPVYSVEKLNKRVELIYVAMGMDGKMIDLLVDDGVDGIVLAGLGTGHVPPDMVQSIENALNQNITMVMTPRPAEGPSLNVYDYKGGGYQLEKMGVIYSRYWANVKARLLLLCMLSSNTDQDQIKRIFVEGR